MPLPIPDELIDHLCSGSDRMIDESIKPDLQRLKGRTDDKVKDDLLDIIGQCINGSLCSGFVLKILQLNLYVDICGGNLEDAVGKIRVTAIKDA